MWPAALQGSSEREGRRFPSFSLNVQFVGCRLRLSKDAAFFPRPRGEAAQNQARRTSQWPLQSGRDVAQPPRRRCSHTLGRNEMSRPDRCPLAAHTSCRRSYVQLHAASRFVIGLARKHFEILLVPSRRLQALPAQHGRTGGERGARRDGPANQSSGGETIGTRSSRPRLYRTNSLRVLRSTQRG
jgi:hypothetical protein